MAKRVLFAFLISIFFNVGVFALTQNEAFLNAAEKKLFCTTYQTETISKRLSRLEKNIYGAPKNNLATNVRISNLKKVPAINSNSACPSSQIAKSTKTPQIQINMPSAPKEIGSYPAIDRLEKAVLKQTHKNEEIYSRLTRLENSVYKKSYQEKDLAWRTDNLNATVFKEEPLPAVDTSQYEMNQQALDTLLSELEKGILAESYSKENSTIRLQRLERKIYNTTYDEDSTYMRLERIVATVEATQKPRTYVYSYPDPHNVFGYNSPYHTVNNATVQSTNYSSARANDLLPFLFFLLLGLFI